MFLDLVLRAERAERFRLDVVHRPVSYEVLCQLSVRLRRLHRILTRDLKRKLTWLIRET